MQTAKLLAFVRPHMDVAGIVVANPPKQNITAAPDFAHKLKKDLEKIAADLLVDVSFAEI